MHIVFKFYGNVSEQSYLSVSSSGVLHNYDWLFKEVQSPKAHDRRTRNSYEKLVRVNLHEKVVRVSYRLAARYFSREFLTSNRACSISCKFLVRLSWAWDVALTKVTASYTTSFTQQHKFNSQYHCVSTQQLENSMSLNFMCVVKANVIQFNDCSSLKKPQKYHIINTWWLRQIRIINKVKFSHTCYRVLGPELIPVYRQSACRWIFKSSQAVGWHYFPPGLRSPIQPKNVTVLRPVPSYTAWQQW